MKALVLAATLIVSQAFINCSPLYAEDRSGVLLTPTEMRAYRACLFAAWVEDYCRENSFRLTANWNRVFAACVAANGGGRFPLVSPDWHRTDEYCWNAARGVFPPRD